MKKLALAAAVLGFACSLACSRTTPDASTAPKDPAAPSASPSGAASATAPAPADPAPKVVKGPQAAASDPSNLPPPGTAPTPVTVDNQLDPIWSASIKTLKGDPTTLAAYKGKALMLVNVASKCGNTPQYSTLEALQKKYESKGFTVIGFPCNQFHNQEPGTAEEIQTFCSTNYGITFPIMEKIDVNGDIRWNFEKFVVSADGKKVTRFSPKVVPEDPAVIAAVEASLPR